MVGERGCWSSVWTGGEKGGPSVVVVVGEEDGATVGEVSYRGTQKMGFSRGRQGIYTKQQEREKER